MNNLEKIQEIRRIISDHMNDLCPYCDKHLIGYIDKKGVSGLYCDEHGRDYIIELIDYFDAIKEIIEHSNVKENPIKYKKITDF